MRNHSVVIDLPPESPKIGQMKPSIVDQFTESLTASLLNKIDTLPMYPNRVCIYKVSEKRRKANEEAYTPRLVSIGPLHHGKTQLQAMQIYKLRCLQNFISRTGINLHILVKLAKQDEYNIRACYEDPIELTSEVFVEMIILDSVFTVELFWKNHFSEKREVGDIIFENRWMFSDILHDMLLLENQLPISFTSKIFTMMDGEKSDLSFLHLAREYFKNVGHTGKLPMTENSRSPARHLVEFLINHHWPSSPRDESLPGKKFEYTRSATELQEAGVKFSAGPKDCLFEIEFSKDKGELIIPKLTVNDLTETFFRNLIAFEQCGYSGKDITSYVILMDSLINTSEDVELLVKRGIFVNDLGESQQVADLFNNLYKEVIEDTNKFYFAKLFEDLNEYSRDYWHQWKSVWFKWKVILKNNYFGNPWSLISVIAGIILLILTVIQTVCAMLQA